jgi:hypothetical protein
MTDVNVGTTPNDGSGDVLRNAFIKLNASIATLTNSTKASASRPGDNPTAFGLSVVGSVDSIPVATATSGISVTAQSSYGNIMRVNNLMAVVAPRVATAAPSGRAWRAYWYMRRSTDAAVPSTAPVAVGLECLDANFASISSIAVATQNRTVSQGLWAVSATFAKSGIALVTPDFVLPVGTVYVRPYVSFGNADHTSDVIQIDIVDITDAAKLGSIAAVDFGDALDEARTYSEAAALSVTDALTAASEAADAAAEALGAAALLPNIERAISTSQGVFVSEFLSGAIPRGAGAGGLTDTANEVHSSGLTRTFSVTSGQNDGFTVGTLDTSVWVGARNATAYVIEADFTLVSGSLDGTGFVARWGNSTGAFFDATVAISAALVSPLVTGQVMQARAILKKPSGFTGTFYRNDLLLVANGDDFGVTKAAKNIKFHRWLVRPATAQELLSDTSLQASDNLAAVANKATALSTLGGLAKSLNLSDLADKAAALVNLGITAAATKINFLANVTSDVQTQINTLGTSITSLWTAMSGKQSNLGYTPVQQGGGVSQLTNKVYLGWDGTRLRLQVDSTDFGQLARISDLPNVATATASLGVGEVGTYALLAHNYGSNRGPGDLVAASYLKYMNVLANASISALAGTWKCMGNAPNAAYTTTSTSVWLRVA